MMILMRIKLRDEELDNILQKLTETEKKFISQFHLEMDEGRLIPSHEFLLQYTVGKNAICKNSTFYKCINRLSEMNIISRDSDFSLYFITNLGWQVRKHLLTNQKQDISNLALDQKDLLIHRMTLNTPFNKNKRMLEKWSEQLGKSLKMISILLNSTGGVIEKERGIVNVLGLILWNTIYQPNLVSIKDFKKMIRQNSEQFQSQIFSIVKFMNLDYYKLDSDKWFTTKDSDYIKRRFNDLLRLIMREKNWSFLKLTSSWNSFSLEDQIKLMVMHESTKKDLQKIIDKTLSHLASEILSQEGHFWRLTERSDPKWLIPRIKLIIGSQLTPFE